MFLRPKGRHPHSPWTLGYAADVTPEPAAAKEPPLEEPTTDDDADDDYDEAGLDYSKIYISEDLTRQRQLIFWKCREAKKSKKIRDCWTTDGQIIIRECKQGYSHKLAQWPGEYSIDKMWIWYMRYMYIRLCLWDTHAPSRVHICAIFI